MVVIIIIIISLSIIYFLASSCKYPIFDEIYANWNRFYFYLGLSNSYTFCNREIPIGIIIPPHSGIIISVSLNRS